MARYSGGLWEQLFCSLLVIFQKEKIWFVRTKCRELVHPKMGLWLSMKLKKKLLEIGTRWMDGFWRAAATFYPQHHSVYGFIPELSFQLLPIILADLPAGFLLHDADCLLMFTNKPLKASRNSYIYAQFIRILGPLKMSKITSRHFELNLKKLYSCRQKYAIFHPQIWVIHIHMKVKDKYLQY